MFECTHARVKALTSLSSVGPAPWGEIIPKAIKLLVFLNLALGVDLCVPLHGNESS